MRTWEAAQSRKIGKSREKIALMIEEVIPGIKVNPEDIYVQHPYYSSRFMDCCKWYGNGDIIFEDGTVGNIGFSSWYRMSDLIKSGIEAKPDGCNYIFEIVPRINNVQS